MTRGQRSIDVGVCIFPNALLNVSNECSTVSCFLPLGLLAHLMGMISIVIPPLALQLWSPVL